MSVDVDVRPLRGARLLVAALGVMLVVVMLSFVVSLAHGGGQALFASLLPLLVLVFVLFLIPALVFGGSFSSAFGSAARSMGSAASRGARTAVRGAASGMSAGASFAGSSALTTSVAVRRFRVRDLNDELVACRQQGDLVSDELRHGDHVLLEGSRGRDGVLRVQRADVLQSPAGPVISVVRTRNSTAHRVALVVDAICLGAGVVVLVSVLVVAVQTFSAVR